MLAFVDSRTSRKTGWNLILLSYLPDSEDMDVRVEKWLFDLGALLRFAEHA